MARDLKYLPVYHIFCVWDSNIYRPNMVARYLGRNGENIKRPDTCQYGGICPHNRIEVDQNIGEDPDYLKKIAMLADQVISMVNAGKRCPQEEIVLYHHL